MASYLLVTDFSFAGRRLYAGEVFSDEAGDPIAGLLSKSAPLVPYTAELDALAQRIRADVPDAHAGAALLTTTAGGSRAVKPDSDGVVRIHVNGVTGSDANDGTSARPFETVTAGWQIGRAHV